MNRATFRQLMEQVSSLTVKQRAQLQSHLQETVPSQPNKVIEGLEQRVQHKPQCPHCDGEYIIRHGRERGIQRYRCKGCKKTFRAATSTPFARLRHKDKWETYHQCMEEGLTLQKASEVCDINIKTAFKWRHRFLQVPRQLKASVLQGDSGGG